MFSIWRTESVFISVQLVRVRQTHAWPSDAPISWFWCLLKACCTWIDWSELTKGKEIKSKWQKKPNLTSNLLPTTTPDKMAPLSHFSLMLRLKKYHDDGYDKRWKEKGAERPGNVEAGVCLSKSVPHFPIPLAQLPCISLSLRAWQLMDGYQDKQPMTSPTALNNPLLTES